MDSARPGLSFIIPAYNEENRIEETLDAVYGQLTKTGLDFEIIVVDDGSRDATRERAESHGHAKVISHPINTGYGSALKTGIIAAGYSWIGIVDADGTYEIELLNKLVETKKDGYHMVVAGRSNVLQLDRPIKRFFRRAYVWMLSALTGTQLQDPNSGFRIFDRELALTFFPFLCNTFSFTTSLTVFAVGHSYFVKFIPSQYFERDGRSKVRHLRDSMRTLQLIVQGISYHNPVKIFLILAAILVFGVGLPAMSIALLGYLTFSLYFLVVATTATTYIGLGVLADTIRISNTDVSSEIRSHWAYMHHQNHPEKVRTNDHT
jgi:glycosyltransferase involved in cell wall biosynthesis